MNYTVKGCREGERVIFHQTEVFIPATHTNPKMQITNNIKNNIKMTLPKESLQAINEAANIVLAKTPNILCLLINRYKFSTWLIYNILFKLIAWGSK